MLRIQISWLHYTKKNGEHISVSCNSSFYSTIWLDKFHGGITQKNREHISFSCNVSFYSAIWLHIQISWFITHKNQIFYFQFFSFLFGIEITNLKIFFESIDSKKFPSNFWNLAA